MRRMPPAHPSRPPWARRWPYNRPGHRFGGDDGLGRPHVLVLVDPARPELAESWRPGTVTFQRWDGWLDAIGRDLEPDEHVPVDDWVWRVDYHERPGGKHVKRWVPRGELDWVDGDVEDDQAGPHAEPWSVGGDR